MKYLMFLIAVPGLIAVGIGCRISADSAAQPEAMPSREVVAQDPKTRTETAPATHESGTDVVTKATQDPKFDANAFPPTVSDTKWHANSWMQNDCLRCHETGVGDAPLVVHRDMPDILLTAKCRTCHVLIPDSEPRETAPQTKESPFLPNAFPPMIPASSSHKSTWLRDDCMFCHESGIRDAPRIVHRGLPRVLQSAKCRTCHVQVRVIDATRPGR